jgi:hypothetical protein
MLRILPISSIGCYIVVNRLISYSNFSFSLYRLSETAEAAATRSPLVYKPEPFLSLSRGDTIRMDGKNYTVKRFTKKKNYPIELISNRKCSYSVSPHSSALIRKLPPKDGTLTSEGFEWEKLRKIAAYTLIKESLTPLPLILHKRKRLS